jgi:hypothetical protein
MKVEATVDIGGNLTSLLERLAQQIGTTADKVFPWYVQQAYVEGVSTLLALAVVVPILVVIVSLATRKPMWTGKYENEPTIALFVSAAAGAMLLFTVIIGTIESVDAVRKVMNPNYYAMKMITRDLGQLVAK